MLYRQSELEKPSVSRPSVDLSLSLCVNHHWKRVARPSRTHACSVTASPLYATSTSALLGPEFLKRMQEETSREPWSNKIINPSGGSWKTDKWRVEERAERELETRTSKRKVTENKREAGSVLFHQSINFLIKQKEIALGNLLISYCPGVLNIQSDDTLNNPSCDTLTWHDLWPFGAIPRNSTVT